MNRELTPVALFVYNRLDHTKRTIEALKKNRLSNRTELFIFSDGYSNEKNKKSVIEIRNFLKTVTGFKKIEIIESPKNKGLANSIIEGVTQIINRYEKIIVLEDDLETSEDFLEYMNLGLEKYENDERVWSISGYSPELNLSEKASNEIYMAPRACSWGWATWKSRWDLNDWLIKDYQKINKSKLMQKQFNLGGTDLFISLKKQVEFGGHSWAIRWCYNQFKNGSYTLYPMESKIRNIGFDNSGVHSYSAEEVKWKVDLKNNQTIFPNKIELNFEILEKFKIKYKLTARNYCGFILRKMKIYEKIKSYKWKKDNWSLNSFNR